MNAALTCICGGCHRVVPPNGGYLGVRHGDITSTQTPGSARWEVYHFDCDPRPEDGYQLGTEQIATWAALAEWDRHLSRKTWLPRTDWTRLMAETADGTGIRIIAASGPRNYTPPGKSREKGGLSWLLATRP